MTTSETSAYDTVTQRVGVCLDFAHLGIALCRALDIPARYFTGYAYELEPPDMHACFECYIGGTWMVFDARRLAHLNGLVRIASGRDAADTAVASVFGDASCTSMKVRCELGDDQEFHPIPRRKLESLAGRASTHAWTEIYLPTLGWRGFDPTIGAAIGLPHVVTGVSQHPRGVMPVSGTFQRGPGSFRGLSVQVETRELAGVGAVLRQAGGAVPA